MRKVGLPIYSVLSAYGVYRVHSLLSPRSQFLVKQNLGVSFCDTDAGSELVAFCLIGGITFDYIHKKTPCCEVSAKVIKVYYEYSVYMFILPISGEA